MSGKSTDDRREVVCPESTIDSANRRSFIRQAALATTAVGVGGTLLAAGSVIPKSSAACSTNCVVIAKDCVIVDYANLNRGSIERVCCGIIGVCYSYALTFGSCKRHYCCCESGLHGCFTVLSGQGIGSARACGAHNPKGLDFYTDYAKRVSITSSGSVGVGTGCQLPTSTLCVVGAISASCSIFPDSTQTNNGSALKPGIIFGGCGGGEGIASARPNCSPNKDGLDFYTDYNKRMSITNGGLVGIGLGACLPSSTLEVKGNAACSTIHGISCVGTAIFGQSGSTTGMGVEGLATATSGTTFGVFGKACSPCSVGVEGCVYAGSGPTLGVAGYARSTCGIGVKGNAWAESGHNVGVMGLSCSPCGISVEGVAGNAGTIPIVAKGASGQTANLQQWESSCGTVFAVINKAGSLGLGGVTKPHHVLCISGKAHASSGFSIGPCVCVNTTLAVNGSMAAKTRAVSSSTTLLTTDYAILASGTITLTLPPAKTQNGMMIFIKNTSTSTVSVVPGGTDTIEGATSSTPKTLTKQYDSLQLISNGTNEWFLLGNSIGDAFVS